MIDPKRQVFVDEYMIDMNAAAAAKRAGYASGTTGSSLLNDKVISNEIHRRKIERSQSLDINAKTVLIHLMETAKADVKDIFNDDGSVKPVRKWPDVWRKGLVTGIDVQEMFNKEGDSTGIKTKIKLIDRLKVWDMIGKHVDVQAFKEKVDVNHTGKVIVSIKNLTGIVDDDDDSSVLIDQVADTNAIEHVDDKSD